MTIPAPIILGSDDLANVHLLVAAPVRATNAADSSQIGWHLSKALGLIHCATDGFDALLATALEEDEHDADDLARERRNWLRVVGVFPVQSVGVAS